MATPPVNMPPFSTGAWPDTTFLPAPPTTQPSAPLHQPPVPPAPGASQRGSIDWTARVSEGSASAFGTLDTSGRADFSLLGSATTTAVGFDPLFDEFSGSVYSDSDGDITSKLSATLFPKLHAVYFEVFHPILPIVNRARFQEELEAEPQSIQVQALSHAIATLGALVAPEDGYAFDACYHHARNLVESCERQDNGLVLADINTLQAYVLLGFYELRKPNLARAWMTLGRATRLARMMCPDGLDDPLGDASHRRLFLLPPTDRPPSPADVEERRRTFWLLYLLDGSAAVRISISPTFDGPQASNPLPCHGELQDITIRTDAPTVDDVFDHSRGVTLSPFAAFITTMGLCRRFAAPLQQALQDPTLPFWDRYYATDRLLSRCQKEIFDPLIAIHGACASPGLIALRINLAAVELCLHQTAVAKLGKEGMSAALTAETNARCQRSANEIANAVRDAQQLAGRAHDSFLQTGVLFECGITKAIEAYLWMLETDRSDTQGHVKTVRLLCNVLTELVDPACVQPGLLEHVEAKIRDAERPAKRRYTDISSGSSSLHGGY
ncbi:fungal-specific transcription factor domain-containing protein [Immersiella caudata]|uniref:Fungal-specific transcription factor domain-containing protein n=1 Tax=Immersiella caudata TaxID=314043 RepID=A0AA40BWV8_9PEZI|nr:fungal-specific transcription factor domain-containing protein [Immersiella caudata]